MLASGFDDAVAKPFSTKELSAKIKNLAENS
jgi:DNA-binding response OmpR family regulator